MKYKTKDLYNNEPNIKSIYIRIENMSNDNLKYVFLFIQDYYTLLLNIFFYN